MPALNSTVLHRVWRSQVIKHPVPVPIKHRNCQSSSPYDVRLLQNFSLAQQTEARPTISTVRMEPMRDARGMAFRP